ncbi:MAG: SET domain-containing protein [Vicinamibacterales bacterium]
MPPAAARPSHQRFDIAVRPSPIDGLGVFTEGPIPARRKIGEMRGERITCAEGRRRSRRTASVMIVEVSARHAIDATASTDPIRFMNHSCHPNARMTVRAGRVEFYALRAIAAGEELTVDYVESHHHGTRRCGCGAPGCAGWL